MRDNNSWNTLDPENSRGPVSYGIKIILILFVLGCVVSGLGYIGGWFGEAGQVVQQEVGPQALLTKYSHFKDMYAQLDKKKADISGAEAGIASFKTDYGSDHLAWPRDVRESYSQKQAELLTMKQSYNSLAAEYNADMAKANWAFTNVGSLPKGATDPLPREVAPYNAN